MNFIEKKFISSVNTFRLGITLSSLANIFFYQPELHNSSNGSKEKKFTSWVKKSKLCTKCRRRRSNNKQATNTDKDLEMFPQFAGIFNLFKTKIHKLFDK